MYSQASKSIMYIMKTNVNIVSKSVRLYFHLLLVPFDTNINQSPCLILELATIAILEGLIQIIAYIIGKLMI